MGQPQAMVSTGYIPCTHGQIFFRRFGRGPDLLLAFPGFADYGGSFLPLAPALSEHFTIFAIDLPFHGDSLWKKASFDPADMRELTETLLAQHPCDSFSLLGHSMGARIVLNLLPYYSNRINHLILLAPEGFNAPYLNKLERLPQGLFGIGQALIDRPGWAISLTQALARVRLLDRFSQKFVEFHLATGERRRRLKGTWKAITQLPVRQKVIRPALAQGNTNTLIVLGKKDSVIAAKQVMKKTRHWPRTKIKTVNEPHRLFGQATQDLLQQYFHKS